MKSYIEKNKHKTNHHIPYAPGIVNPFFGRWFCGWNNMSRKKRRWPRQKCCDFNVGQIQQALRVSLSGPVSINQLLSALGGLWWEATWWLIPLSKWVVTPVINGISKVNPLMTGVITHLLSGMSHQGLSFTWFNLNSCESWNRKRIIVARTRHLSTYHRLGQSCHARSQSEFAIENGPFIVD